MGAILAAAAVVSGFGAAVLIYGPIGTPFRQLSGSTLGAPPVGVTFGNAKEVLASGLPAYNSTAAGANVFNVGGFSNASSVCNTSGVFSPGVPASVDPSNLLFSTGTSIATMGNITSGNTTYVCLNSVGQYKAQADTFSYVNSTWNNSLIATSFLIDTQGYTYVPSGQTYSDGTTTVSSCNSFALSTGSTWDSAWNSTHINNSTFVPCNTFYQMNNNTSVEPSFDGVQGIPAAGYPSPDNSTAWVVNQTGYQSADVVYEVPVTFGTTSTNGTYEITIAIAGVTPVAQTFYFSNNASKGVYGAGTVVFVFDMTAAWLFDASYSYNGVSAVPSTAIAPEIYGAIGLVSTVVSECTSDNSCP